MKWTVRMDTRGCPLIATLKLWHVHTRAHTHTQVESDEKVSNAKL